MKRGEVRMKLQPGILVLLALSTPVWLSAQFGAPAGGAPSRAVQLPLSGRTGQEGGVATVQSTVPGGATVNTITSTVQVQGAYQGSVPSFQTPRAPLQLSLG